MPLIGSGRLADSISLNISASCLLMPTCATGAQHSTAQHRAGQHCVCVSFSIHAMFAVLLSGSASVRASARPCTHPQPLGNSTFCSCYKDHTQPRHANSLSVSLLNKQVACALHAHLPRAHTASKPVYRQGSFPVMTQQAKPPEAARSMQHVDVQRTLNQELSPLSYQPAENLHSLAQLCMPMPMPWAPLTITT